MSGAVKVLYRIYQISHAQVGVQIVMRLPASLLAPPHSPGCVVLRQFT